VSDDDEANQLEYFFAEGDVRLADLNGEVVCSVSTHPGTFRHVETDLPATLVSSVTTSWIGRKQGFARTLTAESLAAGAESGSAIAILGMFEQGFYNRLGFGCGSYEHIARFDPGSLKVRTPFRPPVRLSPEDYQEAAAALRRRKLSHGGVVNNSAEVVRAEFGWTKGLILGYRDESGRLTHFLNASTKGESGPYSISYISYETTDQLMELLALIQALGDQVRSVSMSEPPEIQIQDLLVHPNRQKITTKGTDFEVGVKATAWWQARLLDVEAAIAVHRWDGEPLGFNLQVSDPIDAVLEDGWRGVGGSYVVSLGPESHAERGSAADLPTLTTSVNALTRMWMGALPASGLALTEDLEGPAELLASLDRAFRLPLPRPGTFF
jgi:predicted acetyltransferase